MNVREVNMRLISKLHLAFGLMLCIAFCSSALTVWSAQQAAFYLERTHLAHQVYETYLALSSHTYQLFKQFGDAMLLGDRDRDTSEAALLENLRADIALIRQLIAQEIQMVGEEEIEELEVLARIEQYIQELLAEYRGILDSRQTDPDAQYQQRLATMLDVQIDQDLNQLIEEAVKEEAEEVHENRQETAVRLKFFQLMALVFGFVAATATMISVRTLRRDIKQPIERLLDGAAALSRGELKHRIEAGGPLELGNVARAFNRMASEISNREMALSQTNEQLSVSNTRLEKAVAHRTSELKRLLDTLKGSEANRRRLLADVSHELRTPLTIIRGEADIALRGQSKPPEIYREALGRCRDAANHTARLVDDLLFVARREAGETRLKVEAVELVSLLQRFVNEHRSFPEGNVVTFASTVDNAPIRGDEGRIRQVVLILLENALRYGGKEIGVRLDRAHTGFIVTVSDNGPGMAEEELAHAFERFFRGSNASDRYSQGTGLGLPVAKAIVEAHGGKISLTSPASQGLNVSFILPSRPPLKAVS